MRQFLAVLRRFFHSSLLCTFSCHLSQPNILPSYHASSCYFFLVCLSILLFLDSYIILSLEFYFLPFSIHEFFYNYLSFSIVTISVHTVHFIKTSKVYRICYMTLKKTMQREPHCHLWSTFGTDRNIYCEK